MAGRVLAIRDFTLIENDRWPGESPAIFYFKMGTLDLFPYWEHAMFGHAAYSLEQISGVCSNAS